MSPLIVIGMHRSGTSLLTRVLEREGLFVGWRQQPRHQEARFFQALNVWLLREAGGSWEHPEPMRALVASREFREPAVEFLRFNLGTLRSVSFLGPRRRLRLRSIADLDEPWGWKDPRTTVTLPLWLDVFPEARVLHIRRHGVDVATSLQVRNERLTDALRDKFEAGRWRYHFVDPKKSHTTGFRLTDIDEAMRLWTTYEEDASRYTLELGSDRLLRIRYEDLLAEPRRHLQMLQDFYPISPDLHALSEGFDVERAYAYRHDPMLVDVATRHAADLERFGYSGPS